MPSIRIVIFFIFILSLGGLSCNQIKDKPQAEASDSTAGSIADTISLPEDSSGFTFKTDNEFLGLGLRQFDDLDSMVARRKIRALVPYTHFYYTINLNKRSGVAFEALNLFENSINRQLHLKPQRVRIILFQSVAFRSSLFCVMAMPTSPSPA